MSEPSASLRTVQIILNPISGLPGRASPADVVRETLRAAGVEAVVTPTDGPGHATALARRACEGGVDAVVAIGGDGTVNEVLNGMTDPAVAFATVPTGTSNMLARELGIPFDVKRAAEVIVAGRRRRLDVGSLNGRRFLMVAGFGWDAHVVEEVARIRKGHLGHHRYLGPILRSVRSYEFPPMDVYVDDEEEPRRAHLVFACNTRNYGAWFTLAPDAVPDDGRLDFVLVGDGAARNYLRWVIGAFTGTLPKHREVESLTGTRLRVESDRPVPVQVDGDPVGTTPVTITLDPGALEVFAP